MMRKLAAKGAIVLTLMMLLTGVVTASEELINEKYEAKKRVVIETISGDVIVRAADIDKIHVVLTASIRPRRSFEPEVKVRGNALKIEEAFHGSSSGHIEWEITVPINTEVHFESASGDLTIVGVEKEINASTASGDIELTNCKGKYEISSASGDIELENCSGRFELSTASGDIRTKNCEGEFDASSASGNVRTTNVTLTEDSQFRTASGRVRIVLAETPTVDIEITSASGNATLDYAGNEVSGSFEFIARVRKGDIISPFDFDEEDRFRRHGQEYDSKSFTRGSNKAVITISTASGRAVLDEG